MTVALLNPLCEIEREEYDDESFECITRGCIGCIKKVDRFTLTKECFI